MDRLHFDDLTRRTAGSPPRFPRIVGATLVGAAFVGRQTRAAQAAVCPDRVPQLGYKPTVNGCGADGWTKFPGKIWGADFESGCNSHDICYGTCNNAKADCDLTFFGDLHAACKARGWATNLLTTCNEIAGYYSAGATLGGGDAYDSAQANAWICCDEDGRGEKCGTQCCSSGKRCCPDKLAGQVCRDQDPRCLPCQDYCGDGLCCPQDQYCCRAADYSFHCVATSGTHC